MRFKSRQTVRFSVYDVRILLKRCGEMVVFELDYAPGLCRRPRTYTSVSLTTITVQLTLMRSIKYTPNSTSHLLFIVLCLIS